MSEDYPRPHLFTPPDDDAPRLSHDELWERIDAVKAKLPKVDLFTARLAAAPTPTPQEP